MLKNALIIFLVSMFFVVASLKATYAQNMEIGVNGGISNYLGDLSEPHVDLKETNWSAGAFFRFSPYKHFSFRGGFGTGMISGTDANSKDRVRRKRNLSFYSQITDFYAVAEYSPFGFQTERRVRSVSPYFFIGMNVFHFNPKTEYNGKVYELQPLGTEGQGLLQYPSREKYKLTQVGYPIGFGLRYNLSRSFNIGFEFRYIKTFTDYLDDVSGNYANPEFLSVRGETAVALADRKYEIGYNYSNGDDSERGNYRNKDAYMFTGFTLSYIIRNRDCDKF